MLDVHFGEYHLLVPSNETALPDKSLFIQKIIQMLETIVTSWTKWVQGRLTKKEAQLFVGIAGYFCNQAKPPR